MFKLISIKRIIIDLKNNYLINIKKIKEIIKYNIKKLIIIIGPCSLSNIKEFNNFILKIKNIKKVLLIIRVYYEKPRTNIGWKGYIYDPYIDNSFCILDGLYIIRRLLLDLINLKYLIATECLNFYFFNFFLDCISWVCIGARTTTSQIHREFCSSLKNIIGIKNDISSNLNYLKDFSKCVISNHSFVSFLKINKVIFTKGNKNFQFVLRGGNLPNYSNYIIKKINNSIIIDCSHSNSMKIAIFQIFVFENIINQFIYFKNNINGIMLEAYMCFGFQNIKNIFKNISITDSCIDIKLLSLILKKINDIEVN